MSLPKEFKKFVVHNLTTDFKEAVQLVTAPLQLPKEGEVLVKIKYVGINATDVNMTAGRYFVDKKPPYDIGLEGVGVVVAIGDGVSKVKEGDAVSFFEIGAYTEYKVVKEENLVVVPSVKPEFITLFVSGLTATIGLDKQGNIKQGDKVVVTAAAGGLGQIAVQWCKAAGCHVIALCSSKEKEEFLKTLGCDRIVNYKTQPLREVLSSEYPNGIDVVWETIGGETYSNLVRSLGIKGRLVVVGYIQGYRGKGVPDVHLPDLQEELLLKSATVCGFLLFHYKEHFDSYLEKLISLIESGNLKLRLDNGETLTQKGFKGLEAVPSAVEHLHSGKSFGKVYVELS